MLSCPDFSKSKIVVIGDAMLDRYWHGDTSRISPEAPVPVVRIDRHEERVGGAANVAVNVKALGGQTTLISVIGEDDVGARLTHLLNEKQIECAFIKSKVLNTTLKLRVLGRNQQLIRLDFEDKNPCPSENIIKQLENVIDNCNVIILSDYAKGVISDPQAIIDYARQKGVSVLVDPKSKDLSVYRNATILTPNLGEFEEAVGPCENEYEIETKGLDLIKSLNLQALLVTRGKEGMSLVQLNQPAVHIPAQKLEVFDVTGAGDTVIAVLAASISAGADLVQAVRLANFAGGIAVGRLGTATITKEDLQAALGEETTTFGEGVVTLDELLGEVQRRKAFGKKVVMTNGCFDILHVGHVTYLQQARALGDCLIVAVNDDDSVRRLKGNDRPMNSLMARMKVLAALGCVDYVVAFGEDTPERLIIQVTPHVLVKGGDYTPDQIAGAPHVIKQGGKVKILSFVPGYSTTGLLERANQTQKIAEGVV